jgi:organic radical activating enzyme
MSKIIKIKLANPNSFRISYVMTKSCTYACRYCPTDLHTGSHKELDLENLKIFFQRAIQRGQVVLSLTGGECTTHPQFKDVVMLARELGIKTTVDTNAVRTRRFYSEVGHLVDNWCVTLHPSQHTLDLEKLKILSQVSFLVVYVMMDPAHWETSFDWYNQVCQLTNLKVQPISIMNWGGATTVVTYTDEQMQFLLNIKAKWLFTAEREEELKKTHAWLASRGSTAVYEDGSEGVLDPYILIKSNTNNFQGWQCWAGTESITIHDNNTASYANCCVKQYPHFLDVTEQDLNKPIICPRTSCNCAADIKSTKEL